MSALHCLARISPLHKPSRLRLDIRVCSANLREITGLDQRVWEPAIVSPPKIGMSLFNGDFKAAVQPGGASMTLAMSVLKQTYALADDCYWPGSEVEIWVGRAGDAWPWEQVFRGKVDAWQRKGQSLSLTAEVRFDDKDVLSRTFAGSGDAEGALDMKGRVKPLALGWPQNVEPVLINAVDSVYQFSAYGPIEGVTKLYERGSDFGASAGDYADYAALVAATIPAGRWATCLAEGMVRLGAPAFGVITGDIKGHVVDGTAPRLTGAIVRAAAQVAGISEDQILTETFDYLDSALPYPVSIMVTDQTKLLDLAQALCLPCNAQAGISLLGKLFVARVAMDGSPQLHLNAQGRALPQVVESVEREVSPPYAKTIMGAQRSWRVHTADEIATDYKLDFKGRWNVATTYREGNWVDLEDGSTWLFINATASAGNAPPALPATSNTWWQLLNAPYTAEGITYADGSPIEDLKPLEPGSDITSQINGPAIVSIAADYRGAVTASLPIVQGFSLIRNGVDLTNSATWSVELINGSATVAINSLTGELSISDASGVLTNGSALVTADYGDTSRTFEVRFGKSIASAPNTGTGGGTSATGSVNGSTSSASMTAIGTELTVTAGSAGQVDLSAAYQFTTGQSSGSYSEFAQWYMDVGGSYVAQGSEVEATLPHFPVDYQAGEGECTYTKTGLTTGNTYKFRLYMRNSSGTVVRNITGTCAAVGS